jgi:hypothetical protein
MSSQKLFIINFQERIYKMKTYFFKKSSIIFILVCLFSISVLPQNKQSEPDGIWQGTLKVSAIQLRIVFKIKKTTEGQLTASMDSPDQGAKDIPVDKVTFKNDSLILEMPSLQGEYTGKLNSKGTTVEGTWTQRGREFPLNLKKVEKEGIIHRP